MKIILITLFILVSGGLLVACGGKSSDSSTGTTDTDSNTANQTDNTTATDTNETVTNTNNNTDENSSSESESNSNSTSTQTNDSSEEGSDTTVIVDNTNVNQNTNIINGIVVPPDPGEAGKETVAGVDSNNNGMRDDVERHIAQLFGDLESKRQKAITHAQNIDAVLTTNTLTVDDIEIRTYVKSVVCSSDDELQDLKSISSQYLNTSERWKNYSLKMAGATSAGVSCD